ncbi:MAG: Wzz/FepE/Etk N-terminal domain-containing protein, partial [Thermodesulfobacteriota bacterium]
MAEYDTNQHEQEVHLLDYVRVLRKRKWIILTCFVLVVMVTAYTTLTQTPIYRGTTKIVIEKKNPNVVSVEEVFALDATSTDYYQTQYEILKSRTIARGVIERLNLKDNSAFNPPPRDDPVSRGKRYLAGLVSDLKARVASFVFPESGQAEGVRYALKDEVLAGIQEQESELISRFLASLSIEPVRETRMVQIHFDSLSPVLAARAADAVARVY